LNALGSMQATVQATLDAGVYAGSDAVLAVNARGVDVYALGTLAGELTGTGDVSAFAWGDVQLTVQAGGSAWLGTGANFSGLVNAGASLTVDALAQGASNQVQGNFQAGAGITLWAQKG